MLLISSRARQKGVSKTFARRLAWHILAQAVAEPLAVVHVQAVVVAQVVAVLALMPTVMPKIRNISLIKSWICKSMHTKKWRKRMTNTPNFGNSNKFVPSLPKSKPQTKPLMRNTRRIKTNSTNHLTHRKLHERNTNFTSPNLVSNMTTSAKSHGKSRLLVSRLYMTKSQSTKKKSMTKPQRMLPMR